MDPKIFWANWDKSPILCKTCGKSLTEKQIKKAQNANRIPKYCSTTCWGKRPRKHNYDDSFLNIDNLNEFSSYFMGLWVADGNISKSDKGVSITSVDKQLIDFIVEQTEFAGSISKRYYDDLNRNTQYSIRYYGDISIQIQAMGYPPRAKSGEEFIPDRFKEEPWFHHFVRGFFDGDGSIGIIKNGSLQSSIVNMSKKILEDIHEWLYSKKVIRGGVILKPKGRKIWKLQFSHFDTVQFCEFIYKDAKYYLKRKHTRYLVGKDYIQGCVPQTNTECMIIDCEEGAKIKGLCKKHYDKEYRRMYAVTHKEELREKKIRYVEKNREGINEKRRERYAQNPEKHRESSKKYRKENPEKIQEYKKEHDKNNRETINVQKRAWRQKNLEKVRAQEAASRERNKGQRAASQREYKEKNREELAAKSREYYERTKDDRKEYERERYQRNKEKIKR